MQDEHMKIKNELKEMLFFINYQETIRSLTSPSEIQDDTNPQSIMACIDTPTNRDAIKAKKLPKGLTTLMNADKETLQLIKEVLQERKSTPPLTKLTQSDQGTRVITKIRSTAL